MSTQRWKFISGATLALVGAQGLPAAHAAHRASAPAAILRVAAQGVPDITTLDPAVSSDYSSDLPISMIYNGLLRFAINPDGSFGKLTGELATSWDVAKDGVTYTFHLRPGVRFSDGTPMTSADVIYSFTRALSPKLPYAPARSQLIGIKGAGAYLKGSASGVSGLSAPDAQTVQISVLQPTGYFLDQLVGINVVNRKAVEQYGTSWADHGGGTGPFKIKSVTHGQGMVLVPNTYWYGGKVQLSEVDIPFILSASAAFNAYQTRSLDIAGVGAQGLPTSIVSKVVGAQDFHSAPGTVLNYLDLSQHPGSPFANLHVRRAFTYATEKTTLRRLLGPTFAPTDGFLFKGLPGYNPDLKTLHYSADMARKELALAGYPGGKGFPPITFIYYTGSSDTVNEVEALQLEWQQVLGVQVRIRPESIGLLITHLINRKFDVALSISPATFPDPHGTLFALLSASGFWNDTHYDSLVYKADTMVGDDASRYTIYRQAEQYAVEQAPWIPLGVDNTALLISPRVHGLIAVPAGIGANDWSQVSVQ